MDPFLIVELAALAMDLGKPALRKLLEQDFLEEAIGLTAREFPDLVVDVALSQWAEGEGFDDFLNRVELGGREVKEDDIAALAKAGFSLPDEDTAQATSREVLGHVRQGGVRESSLLHPLL